MIERVFERNEKGVITRSLERTLAPDEGDAEWQIVSAKQRIEALGEQVARAVHQMLVRRLTAELVDVHAASLRRALACADTLAVGGDPRSNLTFQIGPFPAGVDAGAVLNGVAAALRESPPPEFSARRYANPITLVPVFAASS